MKGATRRPPQMRWIVRLVSAVIDPSWTCQRGVKDGDVVPLDLERGRRGSSGYREEIVFVDGR